MAGRKKRKELAQSSTLLDFFATPTPSAKKTRCGGTSITAPAKKHIPEFIADPEDVIIISDEEEEVTGLGSELAKGSNAADMKHVSMFGLPVLLSEGDPGPQCRDILPADGVHDSYIDETSNNAASRDSEVLCGEWGMGDDEDVFQDEADEDDTIEVDEVSVSLCQGSYNTDDTVCPVCGKKLDGLFISVNRGFPFFMTSSHEPIRVGGREARECVYRCTIFHVLLTRRQAQTTVHCPSSRAFSCYFCFHPSKVINCILGPHVKS